MLTNVLGPFCRNQLIRPIDLDLRREVHAIVGLKRVVARVRSDIAEAVTEAGFTIEKRQVVLDRPIKNLGLHPVKVVLHPEVTVEITALVARSPDEAEFLAKGGTLVAETERAALEAAEAARRASEQAAALFEAKPAAEGETAEAPAGGEEAKTEEKNEEK